MPGNVPLTKKLKEEYLQLYTTIEIKPDHFDELDRIIDKILVSKHRYKIVANPLQAPWYFVAAIHNMESSLLFTRHLHNGDPLTARTRHVPAGRPPGGTPPFTWEASAEDALRLRKIHRVDDWTLSRLLYEMEGYNGWGYRLYHQHVKSPYLWGFSTHYVRGKYIADGTWSDTAVSRQCGGAVIVRRLEQRGEIGALVGGLPAAPPLRYANNPIPRAGDLQRFLNSFDGISLRVDEWPGEKTSDAMKKIFGFFLLGDPREEK